MRLKLLLLFLLAGGLGLSQQGKDIFRRIDFQSEKYISANFLSVAEPQLAFGPSFGYRFTERSEFFLEAGYVARSPFYDWQSIEKLNGARLLLQYRYHFLEQGRPLFGWRRINRWRKQERSPFIAAEFRYKPFSFNAAGSFINHSTNDTLSNIAYRAGAATVGGAILFGSTISLSSDDRWKLEVTAGIGGKYRYVNIRNKPAGYDIYTTRGRHQFYPPLPEEGGVPYVPCTIRLRYVIGQ